MENLLYKKATLCKRFLMERLMEKLLKYNFAAR